MHLTIPQQLRSLKLVVVAATLSVACASALAVGGRIEGELSFERDGNPARAEAGEGVAPEFIQSATLRAARSERIDERSGWVLHGQASVRRHDRYHALDELDVGGGALYRIQPDVGFTSPWYELGLAADRSVRSGSSIRNLTRAVANLSTGANLSDRISASAGLRLTRAVADSGSVFDQLERAIDLQGNYRFGGGSAAYGRWSLARGDQVFGSATEEYGSGVKAEADDPALGAGFHAYRARALTRVLEAGAFIPAGPRQSWTLWARGIRSASEPGAVYTTRQMGVSWRYLLE